MSLDTDVYIDPMYKAMTEENKQTILNVAKAQANAAVMDMKLKAHFHFKECCPHLRLVDMVLPENLEEDNVEQYNIALLKAHPDVLKMMFMSGFVQGLCFHHRMSSLNDTMTMYLDGVSYLKDNDECSADGREMTQEDWEDMAAEECIDSRLAYEKMAEDPEPQFIYKPLHRTKATSKTKDKDKEKGKEEDKEKDKKEEANKESEE